MLLDWGSVWASLFFKEQYIEVGLRPWYWVYWSRAVATCRHYTRHKLWEYEVGLIYIRGKNQLQRSWSMRDLIVLNIWRIKALWAYVLLCVGLCCDTNGFQSASVVILVAEFPHPFMISCIYRKTGTLSQISSIVNWWRVRRRRILRVAEPLALWRIWSWQVIHSSRAFEDP